MKERRDEASDRTRRGRRAGLRAVPVIAALVVLVAACAGTSGSQASAPAANADEQTVPMQVVKQGISTLEIVPVTINGQGPLPFLLDTGSSVSSVDTKISQRLGLPTTGETRTIRGVVSKDRVPLVQMSNWKLGSATLAPEQLAAVDLTQTGGGELAGLLGSDELSRFGDIVVDFQSRQLRLGHPQA